MRETVFEALAPCCPRCLHTRGTLSALAVAERVETRGAHLWEGIIHCTDPACWLEFPIIDGIPILVADPGAYISNNQAQILRRPMLSEALTGLLMDGMGPGSDYETTRQHLSLYAGAQFADWAGLGNVSGLVPSLHAGLDMLPDPPQGPAIDIGGSVGRTGWELSKLGAMPAVVADLNFAMLQLGQALALEGTVTFDERRVGLVFDRRQITVPEDYADHAPDFWAVDATASPFATGQFTTACALNVVDCVASPTAVIAEMSRIMADGGGAVICTPFDWAPNVSDLSQWLGGHSQRGPHKGLSEPMLHHTLAMAGFNIVDQTDDQTWRLQTHIRAVMEYQLHLLACKREGPNQILATQQG